MNNIVIDTCALGFRFGNRSCSCEKCGAKPANLEKILNKVTKGDYVIVYSDEIYQEYENTFGGNNDFKNHIWPLWDNNGHVKIISATKISSLLEQLRKNNFAKKDNKFVMAAFATLKKYIISEDPDFWDPQFKKNGHRNAEKMKVQNAGVIHRILRDKGITVNNIYNATVSL